jgi:hypothetical protein
MPTVRTRPKIQHFLHPTNQEGMDECHDRDSEWHVEHHFAAPANNLSRPKTFRLAAATQKHLLHPHIHSRQDRLKPAVTAFKSHGARQHNILQLPCSVIPGQILLMTILQGLRLHVTPATLHNAAKYRAFQMKSLADSLIHT